MFLLSNYLERAYHGLLIPLIGFFWLPLTTLVYAWLANTAQAMVGLNLIIFDRRRRNRFGRSWRRRISSANEIVGIPPAADLSSLARGLLPFEGTV